MLESDQNNAYLHQMIGTESDNKQDNHLSKDIELREC
jgi:hypothetical protein